MLSAYRLSVGANVFLIGIVAVFLWRDRPIARPQPALPGQSQSASPAVSETVAVTHVVQPTSGGTKLSPAAVAQLEKMGISRDTLVNIVIEDLNQRTGKRMLDLQKKYAPKSVPDRELRALSRESEDAQVRELKAALGEVGYLAWDQAETLRALNRARVPGDELPMSPAEAGQAYRLQKEFDDKNRELQMIQEDGAADRADVSALQAQAQQTLDSELMKLLGPQRFNELRGNIDPTTQVYQKYGDLNPTPDQVKAVVQAQQDYRAREAALTQQVNVDPAKVAAELKAMNEAQDENLRQVFGAEAYDTMKRQTDPTYQTLQQFATAWNLNRNDVQQVYASIHDFQQQADRLRSAEQMSEQAGQHVDWNAVNVSIAQAQLQTEMGLQNEIGADRLQRLKQNGMLTVQ